MAQTDRIFTEKYELECNIKSVDSNMVYYSLPNEIKINSLVNNKILKIIYANGKVMDSEKLPPIPAISNILFFDSILICYDPAITKHLLKLEEFTATVNDYISIDDLRLKMNRAVYNKKLEAAFINGKVIRITNYTHAQFDMPQYWFETLVLPQVNIKGIIYTTEWPDTAAFGQRLLKSKKFITESFTKKCCGNTFFKTKEIDKLFFVEQISDKDGSINFTGTFAKDATIYNCRLVKFTDKNLEFITSVNGEMFLYKLRY
jgi:hypothetical protein